MDGVARGASTFAPGVDRLFWAEVAICGSFALLIALLLVFFAFRYREGSPAGRRPGRVPVLAIEATWIGIPLLLALWMFAAGASLYFELRQAPPGALEVRVVGRRWMWKIQHPGGKRELNELHVPRGRPIRLVMTSQDVIHSFFVPAFRMKQDVLPGRYTSAWFEATRNGEYRLFCAEYCGTDHSGMVGRVVVLDPADYQRWLAGEPAGAGEGRLASPGRLLFERLGCAACHEPEGPKQAPGLAGVFGSRVRLRDGGSVAADEAYLRESILEPAAKVVAGYRPLMPSFRGRVSDAELRGLLDYIRSLAPEEP